VDKAELLDHFDTLIEHYLDHADQLFYLREEYRDGGRRRGVLDYQLEVVDGPPDPEHDDGLALPLDIVRVGVQFGAVTRLDPLDGGRRYVRLSGRAVAARLQHVRDLAEHNRIQPPGSYAGVDHATLRTRAFVRLDIG
jgi:hypothetical protein